MGVSLAGWVGDVPAELDGLWRHVSDGPPETNYPTTSSVLVLGAGATAEGVRDAVTPALDRFGGSVLHVQGERVPMSGHFAGATRISRADVVRYVQHARKAIPLQRVPLSEWLDTVARDEPTPQELDVLRLLPRLHHMDAEWWRRSSGLTRTRLGNLTQRVLRVNPGAAVKRYRLASARWLASHDHSLSAIAAATCYSSKQSLSRALRGQR